MDKIILDPQFVHQLHELVEPLNLCDPSGRILARAVPVVDISQCDPVTPGISDEELNRRSASNEAGYSTRELLDRLGQL